MVEEDITLCPGCNRPVPHPGQYLNCLDALRREWHWECAEALLGDQVITLRGHEGRTGH